jgi:hypothetical protein
MPTHVITANNVSADPNTGNVAIVQTVYSLKTVLTDAQIKALPTTPIDLVPSPGVDKAIVSLGGFMKIDAIAGAYTNIAKLDSDGVTAFFFGHIPASCATLPMLMTSNALNGSLERFKLVPYGFSSIYTNTDEEVVKNVLTAGEPKLIAGFNNVGNTAFKLIVDNYDAAYETDMGNFTGGHPDNTIEVTIFYTIVDL